MTMVSCYVFVVISITMTISIFRNCLLAGLTTCFIYGLTACRTTYRVTTGTFAVSDYIPDKMHGKALVFNSCGGCHYDYATSRFTGKRMKDLPGIMGKVYASNITASPTTSVIPHYTDAEFAYLVRTGITRKGHFMPYMLRPNMSDHDIHDMLAYLRSGDDAVRADERAAGKTRLNFMGRMSFRLVAKPQPYQAHVAQPEETIAKGRYLADNLGCFHCHSRSLTSLNYRHPEQSKGYMAGGAKFKKTGGGKIRGTNITMDKATGIGYYTRADFKNALVNMQGPGNRELHAPMEAFQLSDTEVDAIYAYLQTLPPKHHKVRGQPTIVSH